MPIYQLGDLVPVIHPEAYIHPEAVLIGDVTVGSEATVWPGAVLRGDYGTIVIGARSSVQDGTVIHAGPGFPTIVGDGCVIGHLAHLEGCTMEGKSNLRMIQLSADEYVANGHRYRTSLKRLDDR